MSPETQSALRNAAGRELVASLRQLSLRSLGRMFRPEENIFGFRLKRDRGRIVLEGRSARYTAIALLGLARESAEAALPALQGQNPLEVCGSLLLAVDRSDDLGAVALALWAARALHLPSFEKPLRRLKEMDPARTPCSTVEISWCLSALTCPGPDLAEDRLVREIAGRLLSSFQPRSGLFPHWPGGPNRSSPRSHVTCFADAVYPIQALSRYSRVAGSREALEAAVRCAAVICGLQGPEGQWWWHYDARTGQVVEKYPVYSVHQDAMAPMALFSLKEAGGPDHSAAVWRGLEWLKCPPEIGYSLIDEEAGVIWRKVARREPWKLSRSLQALASYLHPDFRLPLERLLPPLAVDFECRPYHLGWILHAWPREELPASG